MNILPDNPLSKIPLIIAKKRIPLFKFSCTYCKKRARTLERLIEHVRNNHGKNNI